jgi:general secretion pathway protein L
LIETFAVMSMLNQDAGELLLRGYSWWTDELLSLVPGTVTSSWRADKPDAVVVASNGHVQVGGVPFSGPRANISGPDGGDVECWNRIAHLGKSRRSAQVHVLVPYAACLVRNLDVPAAASTKAASILALDLERALPFDLADVYTAHVIDAIKPAPGMVRLNQLIVKRDKVDPIVARIEAAFRPV